MKVKKGSRVKQVILSIAIALVLTFFIAYGMSVFYEAPKYENYCNVTAPAIPFENKTTCEVAGGQWNPTGASPKAAAPCYDYTSSPNNPTPARCPDGYCDMYFTCQKEFNNAESVYNRDVFFASSLIGLIAIILGIVLQLESVSVGIMGGGVLLIIYGTIRYWGELGKYLRLAVLGLVLAILIWIGYKKFGKK